MTSHWYVVVDAGGNVYPGTFNKDSFSAQCQHVAGGSHEYYLPCEKVDGEWRLKDDQWRYFADRGDHVIRCTIETDETVKVTLDTASQSV